MPNNILKSVGEAESNTIGAMIDPGTADKANTQPLLISIRPLLLYATVPEMLFIETKARDVPAATVASIPKNIIRAGARITPPPAPTSIP